MYKASAVSQPQQYALPAPKTSVFLICDIQDQYGPNMPNIKQILASAKLLISLAHHLKMPVIATEQYPKVFGHTYAELLKITDNIRVIEKTKFSMNVDGVVDLLKGLKQAQGVSKHIILCGFDAHICILQTALDFLVMGYNVHVCVDAIGSQRSEDMEVAIRRLDNAGVSITTTESLAYQLLRDARHESFKDVQPLIKQHLSDLKLIDQGKEPLPIKSDDVYFVDKKDNTNQS